MFTYSSHSYKHIRTHLLDWGRREFNISYLAPARAHWKLVTIQVRRTLVPELEKEYITCRSLVEICCSEAQNIADNLEDFYESHLKSGEWINGGHRLEVPENPSNQSCKKRQKLVQDGLQTGDERERECNSTPTSTSADTLIASTASTRLPPTVRQLRNENTEIVRQIDLNSKSDLEDANFVSSAIKKFQAGIDRLRDHNAGIGLCIDFDTRLSELRLKLSKTSDLEEAATGLSTLQKQTRGHAESMGWRWEHLIRCIRILQRQRGFISAMEDTDGVSARQEKSAFRINAIANNLSKHMGSLALVLYSAFSAIRFTWSSFGRIDDVERVNSIVERVSNQVMDIGFQLPEGITLFNPATTLSWLLGESYSGICKDLGLGDLPAVDPTTGEGIFKEIPLDSIAQGMSGLIAVTLQSCGEQKSWVLKGRCEDEIGHKRATKKRKRSTGLTEAHERHTHERHTHHEAGSDYVQMYPISSQVGLSIPPRSHTTHFPTCILNSHDKAEHSMFETNNPQVLPRQVETVITTTDRNDPGGLSIHITSLQAPNVATHSLWPNAVSTSQEGNPVIHDAFMGSIVPSQDLLNIESSYVREHWV